MGSNLVGKFHFFSQEELRKNKKLFPSFWINFWSFPEKKSKKNREIPSPTFQRISPLISSKDHFSAILSVKIPKHFKAMMHEKS